MTFQNRNTKASKLTALKVLEIREKYASGEYTMNRLSREYSVTPNTISNVVNGVTWQTVPRVDSDEQISYEAKLSEKRFLARIAADPPTAGQIHQSQELLFQRLSASDPDREDPVERMMREASAKRAAVNKVDNQLDSLVKTGDSNDSTATTTDPALPTRGSGPDRE